MSKVKLNLSVDEDVKELLKQKAEKRHQTVASMITDFALNRCASIDFLEYKVYRNDSELVAIFGDKRRAESFIDSEKTFDTWKIYRGGEKVYDSEEDL